MGFAALFTGASSSLAASTVQIPVNLNTLLSFFFRAKQQRKSNAKKQRGNQYRPWRQPFDTKRFIINNQ